MFHFTLVLDIISYLLALIGYYIFISTYFLEIKTDMSQHIMCHIFICLLGNSSVSRPSTNNKVDLCAFEHQISPWTYMRGFFSETLDKSIEL